MGKEITKSAINLEIPKDFVEKYSIEELYSTIRDDKTIYAKTTFPRVVPYYKDGLIEVYRKALWEMYNSKLFWIDENHVVKSATTVGNIIGKWHPHGDASSYQAMVTLAQDYTNNEPLIYGAGNWGNILGDAAAAYRYTNCCLSAFFCDCIEQIKPEIVDFIPNFDNTLMEPDYIPFKLPILLVNGSYGIADSYITSIPCHNLADVCDISIKYVKNKHIPNEILVDGFYPDFPYYGIVANRSEVERFYKMNVPGNIKMKATIETDRINNKIFIKDLPYNMTKNDIMLTIKSYHEKKHAVLSKVTDIIEIKKIKNGELYMEFEVLFDKNTNILELARDIDKLCTSKTIPLSFIMYDGTYVHQCTIKDIIKNWYNTLYTTKVRKINYQSSIFNHKKHILEGMLVVYDHLDEVIGYAKKSTSTQQLIEFLSSKLKLTDIQSEAISKMTISQLNNVSKEGIIASIKDFETKIKDLDGKVLIIDDEIISDLETIKAKYGRPRRTVITELGDEIQESSQPILISNGALLWSHNQYAIFDLQNLVNGKALTNGLKTVKIDNKNVKEIIGCTNINRDVSGIIIFTSDGCAKKIETKDIEANNWNAFSEDPIIVSAVPVFSESDKIIIAMKSGKMKIIESNQITTTSSKVGDVSCAEILDETKDYVMFLNRTGSYHLIKISEIPELGRSAVGVNINLCSEIIYMTQIERNSDDTFITSLQDKDGISYIMKTSQDELEDTNRANKPKKLFDLDDGFITTGINSIDIRDKDAKCILIGPYSSSQISIQNIRTSDMTKIPKRVPVNVLGIITYNL